MQELAIKILKTFLTTQPTVAEQQIKAWLTSGEKRKFKLSDLAAVETWEVIENEVSPTHWELTILMDALEEKFGSLADVSFVVVYNPQTQTVEDYSFVGG